MLYQLSYTRACDNLAGRRPPFNAAAAPIAGATS